MEDRDCVNMIMKYMDHEYKDKAITNAPSQNWKILFPKDIPRQLDSHNCGMFLLEFTKYISLGRLIDFNGNSIEDMRRDIVYELITKSIY